MPSWAKAVIDDWPASSGFPSGLVLGAVNEGDFGREEAFTTDLASFPVLFCHL